jgi:hypothetical protein
VTGRTRTLRARLASETPWSSRPTRKVRAEPSVRVVGLALAIGAMAGAPAAVPAQAPPPQGLAAEALANRSFSWIHRSLPRFRVYFLAGSYAARHQDSLLARLPYAFHHAETLLHVSSLAGPIDLFFLESRAQMIALIGQRATGFAQASARAVFLVTNPGWRAFERHEIMHVVAGQAWGPPGPDTAWLQEGLAQAADGRCDRYSNAGVLLALTRRRGWIPLEAVLTNFRAQPDLRAYLQAAAFVDYLLRTVGPAALAPLWRRGATDSTLLGARTLRSLEHAWREALADGPEPDAADLTRIEATGCGGGPPPALPGH